MRYIFPGWLTLAARLSLAASMSLLACDQQPQTPQDPFAVSLEQAQQVAEHLANSSVAAGTTTLKIVANHYVLNAEQRPALYVFNYQGGGRLYHHLGR